MSDLTQNNTNTSQHGITKPGQHQQDGLSRVTWASIFVLAGLVFFADNLGYLPAIEGVDSWKWVLLGAGGLLLLENIIRVFSVDHRGPHPMGMILGVILLSIGAGAIFGVDIGNNWIPLVLIGLGLFAIAKSVRGS